MGTRRGTADERLLCSGPGWLTQALALKGEHDGFPLDRPPFELRTGDREVRIVTGTGTRIGISQAADRPWRYGLAGSRFLSRPIQSRSVWMAGPAMRARD